MSRINTGRVILAGLVAGLVINIVDLTVNVHVIGHRWNVATRGLGIKPDEVNWMLEGGWIAMDLLAGLFAAWLYAAIRPRFGAGAGTALRAGFVTWLMLRVGLWSLAWDGLYPRGLLAASAAVALIATLAGGWVAGRLYREPA
jgi:hypothetical protein